MANSVTNWLAGTSERAITPPLGAPLLGAIQRSTGIHDDLFARVLVLSDGTSAAVIAGIDLIGMDFTMADEIRKGIQEKTGIDTQILNCSHTHSAPFTIPWSVLGRNWLRKEGWPWRQEVVRKVIDAAVDAASHLHPVQLRCGRNHVQVGLNRRLPSPSGVVMKPNPDGALVPWVDVLSIDDLNGRPLCVLFSHAAHPLIIHALSNLVSADYVGAAVQEIRNQLGDAVLPVFTQGCSANINGDPLRGGFDKAAEAGKKLGLAVLRARDESEPLAPQPMHTAHRFFHLPLRSLPSLTECDRALDEAQKRLSSRGRDGYSDDELWEMQAQVDVANAKPSGEDDVQPMENQPWWLQDTVLCLQDLRSKILSGQSESLRFEIQALRIGNAWSLTAMTHELFAELRLWYDENSPCAHNMMLAYTNGCESYIPTDSALADGGYEANSFPLIDGGSLRYPYRVSIKEGAYQRIEEALRQLWEAGA